MIIEDLKLLVDVAWHERHGQQGFTVGKGFYKARERLVAEGLLVKNSTEKYPRVTLTQRGIQHVLSFMGVES